MNDLKKKKDAKRQQTFFLFLWKKKKIKETIIRCSKWDKRQKFVWKVIIPSTKCSIGVFYRWLIKLLELLFRARSTRVKRRMTRANRTIGVNFSCQLPLGFAPFSPLPTPPRISPPKLNDLDAIRLLDYRIIHSSDSVSSPRERFWSIRCDGSRRAFHERFQGFMVLSQNFSFHHKFNKLVSKNRLLDIGI